MIREGLGKEFLRRCVFSGIMVGEERQADTSLDDYRQSSMKESGKSDVSYRSLEKRSVLGCARGRDKMIVAYSDNRPLHDEVFYSLPH